MIYWSYLSMLYYLCVSPHTHWCMTMFHVVWLFDCHTLDFAPIVGSLSLPTMFSSLSSVSFQTFLLSAAQPKFITGERAVLSRITVRSQSCSVFLWSWLERPLCFSFVLTSSSELRISPAEEDEAQRTVSLTSLLKILMLFLWILRLKSEFREIKSQNPEKAFSGPDPLL